MGDSKVFSAGDGYSVDHNTGRYIFTYREEVPSWWGMIKSGRPSLAFGLLGYFRGPRKEIAFAVAGGLLGLFTASNGLQLIFGAGLGAFLGYHLGRIINPVAAGLPPLTGKPDRNGIVKDFQTQVEVDGQGHVLVYREWQSSDPKMAKSYEPTQFHLSEIASIERKTYDEVYPDTLRNPGTGAGKRARDEVKDLQKVIFVFRDGQMSDAGWIRGGNPAARLQYDLIAYFDECSARAQQAQSEAYRLARIAPGDAPL